VRVQRHEELPVGETLGEPVRSVHCEGRLADPGHPADRMDAYHLAISRHAGPRLQQVRQFGLAAGEVGVIPRQGPGSRSLEGPRWLAVPSLQNICSWPAAAGRRDEQRARRPG
jgi:hypothetical protein